jgi:hypothetical protein
VANSRLISVFTVASLSTTGWAISAFDLPATITLEDLYFSLGQALITAGGLLGGTSFVLRLGLGRTPREVDGLSAPGSVYPVIHEISVSTPSAWIRSETLGSLPTTLRLPTGTATTYRAASEVRSEEKAAAPKLVRTQTIGPTT